ncbi:MAG: PilZ domain-containing protein [Gammaproteobacteria bacterium]|nr:PilZ domain-containing protein [Gammaproteobacteria bacterium]MDH3466626.1 PilZ domain-containing protein [Gammaproteobacteria bacterium]
MKRISKPALHSAEKREYRRVPVNSAVGVRNSMRLLGDAGGNMADYELVDMSFNGVRIRGSMAPGEVGDRLEVELPAGNKLKIGAIGTVVRIDREADCCIACVHFERISMADQVQLDRILSLLSPESTSTERLSPLQRKMPSRSRTIVYSPI